MEIDTLVRNLCLYHLYPPCAMSIQANLRVQLNPTSTPHVYDIQMLQLAMEPFSFAVTPTASSSSSSSSVGGSASFRFQTPPRSSGYGTTPSAPIKASRSLMREVVMEADPEDPKRRALLEDVCRRNRIPWIESYFAAYKKWCVSHPSSHYKNRFVRMEAFVRTLYS